MSDDLTERLHDLRDRAHRIVEAAKQDDDVPPSRVAELEHGLQLIEMGWDTVESHPNPRAVAPFNLDAKINQWERQFDEKEKELGID